MSDKPSNKVQRFLNRHAHLELHGQHNLTATPHKEAWPTPQQLKVRRIYPATTGVEDLAWARPQCLGLPFFACSAVQHISMYSCTVQYIPYVYIVSPCSYVQQPLCSLHCLHHQQSRLSLLCPPNHVSLDTPAGQQAPRLSCSDDSMQYATVHNALNFLLSMRRCMCSLQDSKHRGFHFLMDYNFPPVNDAKDSEALAHEVFGIMEKSLREAGMSTYIAPADATVTPMQMVAAWYQ